MKDREKVEQIYNLLIDLLNANLAFDEEDSGLCTEYDYDSVITLLQLAKTKMVTTAHIIEWTIA